MAENIEKLTPIFSGDSQLKRVNKVWLLPFLSLFFIIGGQILSMMPAVRLGLIDPKSIETYPTITYFLLLCFGAIFLLVLLWTKLYEGRSIASLGLGTSSIAKEYGYGAGVGIAFAALSVFVIFIVGGYQAAENLPFTVSSLLPVAILLIGFCFQSWVEEVLFRGWLLSRAYELKGEFFAIIFSSLMFMVVHLLSIEGETVQFPGFAIFVTMTFLFSTFLAKMTLHFKSIWFAAGWHGLWNWFFINGAGLPTTGIDLNVRPLFANLEIAPSAPYWLTGGSDGPENSIITMAVLIMANIYVFKYLNNKHTN